MFLITLKANGQAIVEQRCGKSVLKNVVLQKPKENRQRTFSFIYDDFHPIDFQNVVDVDSYPTPFFKDSVWVVVHKEAEAIERWLNVRAKQVPLSSHCAVHLCYHKCHDEARKWTPASTHEQGFLFEVSPNSILNLHYRAPLGDRAIIHKLELKLLFTSYKFYKAPILDDIRIDKNDVNETKEDTKIIAPPSYSNHNIQTASPLVIPQSPKITLPQFP